MNAGRAEHAGPTYIDEQSYEPLYSFAYWDNFGTSKGKIRRYIDIGRLTKGR